MQVLILMLAGPAWRSILRTRNLPHNLLRAGFSSGASFTTTLAVIYLPLALATALSFTYAIFVTIGAVIFLRENVGRGRWVATLIGLGGVVLMLSPLESGNVVFIGVALLGAALSAGMVLTLRGTDPDESILTVITYQFLPALPILLIPTILTWQTPTPEQWAWLGIIAVSSLAGQYLLIRAYQLAEASHLASLDFVRLVMMVGCGLVFFGESVSMTLLVGTAIVLCTTLYTVSRNSGA
jgi:drug/metabolite transporter (DMT)-like permease